MQLRLRYPLNSSLYIVNYIFCILNKNLKENANKKTPPEIMPHCEKSKTKIIVTLITASVCILRHFFIETMTTTLPYKSQTSKMQQEKVIQSDCKNTNRNSNHDISQYHNPIPCHNIGTSRCKKGITKA